MRSLWPLSPKKRDQSGWTLSSRYKFVRDLASTSHAYCYNDVALGQKT